MPHVSVSYKRIEKNWYWKCIAYKIDDDLTTDKKVALLAHSRIGFYLIYNFKEKLKKSAY